MDKPSFCPRCGSTFLTRNADGDYGCICGNVLYDTAEKGRTAGKKITVGGFYPKTIKKMAKIKEDIASGSSIEKASRDNNMAPNTVRKILRKDASSLFTEMSKEMENIRDNWINRSGYEPMEGLVEYFPDNFVPTLRKWATQCSTESMSRGKAHLDGQAHALTLIANLIEQVYQTAGTAQDDYEHGNDPNNNE